MKAVLWISFLLFAAAMAGGYYYYDKVYTPKQAKIQAAEEAKRAEMQAQIEAERARLAERRSSQPTATVRPPQPEPQSEPEEEEVTIEIPKARPISTGGGSIRDSFQKEEPKTPEEIQRDKELAELRLVLREMQARGERE